jgi:ssDNA-binding Zn-finger/Zn-ribbon topoisomerase 1
VVILGMSGPKLLSSFRRWASTRPGQITLAAALVIPLGTAFVLFGGAASTSERARYSFLSCPKCSFEQPFNEFMLDRPCPKCKRGPLNPARQSSSQAGPLPTTLGGKALLLGLVTVVLAQVVIYSWLTYARSAGPEEDDEDMYKSRCPRCGRKMLYPASKAGFRVRCYVCKLEFNLPEL